MRILVVEDDAQLAQQIVAALEEHEYVVDVATDGNQAHYIGSVESIDAVVLDLGLPELDGLTVLQRWRSEGLKMPVLILTARDGWHEKVLAIDAGADDYLTKPFHMPELLARLRALLRRLAGQASAEMTCGALVLDTRLSRFSYDGQAVSLTSYEFRVLSYLMHHAGQIISRSQLSEHIYAQDQDRDSNTIDVFIGRLRKKIPTQAIETVRGQGYRLVPVQTS